MKAKEISKVFTAFCIKNYNLQEIQEYINALNLPYSISNFYAMEIKLYENFYEKTTYGIIGDYIVIKDKFVYLIGKHDFEKRYEIVEDDSE